MTILDHIRSIEANRHDAEMAAYADELRARPTVQCHCCGKLFDHKIEGFIWSDGSCLCGKCSQD